MPRASKSQPTPPTGPRLVKRTPSKPKPPAQPEIGYEQIALRAFELFQEEGCVHGRHVEHWLRAERELKVVPQAPPKRVAAARARR